MPDQEVPNPKVQTPKGNSKRPSSKITHRVLVVEIWCFRGAWVLVLGTFGALCCAALALISHAEWGEDETHWPTFGSLQITRYRCKSLEIKDFHRMSRRWLAFC
jgi:hypothetical protein